MTSPEKVNLFISYAHADNEYLPELLKYLNEKTCPQINIWVDRNLSLGQEWNDEIINNLKTADIVLLLISQDFLMSTYIQNNEVSGALKKNEDGQCIVVPIFLRYCNLKQYPEITKLQGYPSIETPLVSSGIEKDRYYTEIQEKINSIAEKLITNKNVSSSIDDNSDHDKSGKAKAIEQLRNIKSIFLSVPASAEGAELRKNFIISVEGKIKYDTPTWPYDIIPGFNEAKDISNSPVVNQGNLFENFRDKFIYSIFIIGSGADINTPSFNIQYALAKKSNVQSSLNLIILWFVNSAAKDELDNLDEPTKIELKMLPAVVGSDSRSIFKLIEEFDATRDKKINELLVPFSPVKKVYMFYDYSKDNENDLRILLRKKIQDDKKFAVRDLSYETIEDEKQAVEECTGAIIFYGSNCDSIWYKMRERIILKAKNIKSGAVCIGDADEPQIEKKIDRDVSYNEIQAIKGEKDLDTGITVFKSKLQED